MLDCAVVGIPHEHLGEVAALFVVARLGQSVEIEVLLGHCREQLRPTDAPRPFISCRSPAHWIGKIISYKLREQLNA